jgi:hypothetical protein
VPEVNSVFGSGETALASAGDQDRVRATSLNSSGAVREYLQYFQAGQTAALSEGLDLSEESLGLEPVAATLPSVLGMISSPALPVFDGREGGIELSASLEGPLRTLVDPNANPVARSYAANQLARQVTQFEDPAYDSRRLRKAMEQGDRSLVGSRDALASEETQLNQALARAYVNPVAARNEIDLLVEKWGRYRVTADLQNRPEMFGDLRGGLFSRNARAEAITAAGDAAIHIGPRLDAAAEFHVQQSAAVSVKEAARTPEARDGCRAEATLGFIARVLGLAGPANATELLLLAQDTALMASPTDALKADFIPPAFVSAVVEQMVRYGSLQALEDATPARSRLMQSKVTPSSASPSGLSPIDRFTLANEVVAANSMASDTRFRDGDMLGADTANNWSDRAALHLVEAAVDIKRDFEMVNQANARGILAQIEAIIEAAKQRSNGYASSQTAQSQ